MIQQNALTVVNVEDVLVRIIIVVVIQSEYFSALRHSLARVIYLEVEHIHVVDELYVSIVVHSPDLHLGHLYLLYIRMLSLRSLLLS